MNTTLKLGLSIVTLCFFSQAFAHQNHSQDSSDKGDKLHTILALQNEQTKARYPYRHPYETLNFFGIKPGMTVVEALPGGGWYSKIIASYLGKEGHIIAGDYPASIWKLFGWADDAYIQKRLEATAKFPTKVTQWVASNTPTASAYTLDKMPESLNNSVDAVLFIRALHNLNRFNATHQFADNSFKAAYRILKKGGIVGIVQHETALTNASGEWGYLNRNELVASMEKAGFTLAAETDINNKPKQGDYVWRLPPSLDVANDEEKVESLAIGESNRMTLLFKKSS